MSKCSCYSDEDPSQSFWKKLAKKYEKRIQDLAQKKTEVRHRLEVLQMQMPAYLCYRLRKSPEYAEKYIADFMNLFTSQEKKSSTNHVCTCDPCPIKVPNNFPNNLYDFKYPQPISRFKRTKRNKKELDTSTKKNIICNCNNCEKMVIKRLRDEGFLLDQDMIPEKLYSEKESEDKNKILNKPGECTCCMQMSKGFRDATVCECDLCAAEVLRRINCSDLSLQPLECGCDPTRKPIPLDVEIPICQCESCKLELKKRLGHEPAERIKTECICYKNLGAKPDLICDCDTCAEKLELDILQDSCECKIGDTTILPICTCTECKKKSEEEFDLAKKCICNCDECNKAREIISQTAQPAEAENAIDVKCICSCEICNKSQQKQAEEDLCSCEIITEPCSCDSTAQTCIANKKASQQEVQSTVSCTCTDTVLKRGVCTVDSTTSDGRGESVMERGIRDSCTCFAVLDISTALTSKSVSRDHICSANLGVGGELLKNYSCACSTAGEKVVPSLTIEESNEYYGIESCICFQRAGSQKMTPVPSARTEVSTKKSKDSYICPQETGKHSPRSGVSCKTYSKSNCVCSEDLEKVTSTSSKRKSEESCVCVQESGKITPSSDTYSKESCVCSRESKSDIYSRDSCICSRESERDTSGFDPSSEIYAKDSCECSQESERDIPGFGVGSGIYAKDSCVCSQESERDIQGFRPPGKIYGEDSCVCSQVPSKSSTETFIARGSKIKATKISEESCICPDETAIDASSKRSVATSRSGSRKSSTGSCVCPGEVLSEKEIASRGSSEGSCECPDEIILGVPPITYEKDQETQRDAEGSKRKLTEDFTPLAFADLPKQELVQGEKSAVESDMELNARTYDAEPNDQEEYVYKRVVTEEYSHETKSICSCTKNMKNDGIKTPPLDCATKTQSCCCLRTKNDVFSKVITEKYELQSASRKGSSKSQDE